jgi:hypothetical protein
VRAGLLERQRASRLVIAVRSADREFAVETLPIDRAIRIYTTVANRAETKGAREGLSKHLEKMYVDGERTFIV